MSEAFIYLWYVVLTKKYYLGVHNGKDPYYTHSAESSEEFRAIVPHSKRPIKERKEFWDKYERGEIKGIRYRKLSKRLINNFSEKLLLEDGTDYGKMCELENNLLINRKNLCWDRYYNEGLGDPRYVDMSGENNPSYTNGMSVGRASNDPEIRKAAERKREQLPERKAYRREWDKTPKRKAYKNKWGRANYAKKKAERQGEGTLEAFFDTIMIS